MVDQQMTVNNAVLAAVASRAERLRSVHLHHVCVH